jgi:hypothetical protein
MNNYICTYFFYEKNETGSTYGNIFLPIKQRNIIYWQTIYTFYFTAIVINKNNNSRYAFFTNEKVFPFREKLEKMGVIIFDDLKLKKINKGKWATVNFFFDVIDFIVINQIFKNDDAFILLDTDVISISNSSLIFKSIRQNKTPIGHVLSSISPNKKNYFHNLRINELESEGTLLLNKYVKITELIGGEFFAFSKNNISNFQLNYRKLLSNNDSKITTEEQILTILNSIDKFSFFSNSIYRVWNTLKKINIPNNYRNYIFIHLPSDKEFGLKSLFDNTINLNPLDITSEEMKFIIIGQIPLYSFYKMYFNVIKSKILKHVI